MPADQIPSDNQLISLATAIEMTTRYRASKENILAPEYRGQDILALSETFNKDALNSFFTNQDCKAIRIYYGMYEDLKVHAIIVGVNDQNEDILPADPVIVEDGKRCPPFCPEISPLTEQ